MDLLGESNEATNQTQRLSLSLSSASCRQRSLNLPVIDLGYVLPGACNGGLDRMIGDFSFSFSPPCPTLNTTESFSTVVRNSKYLKPAQSLLEEMASIGAMDIDDSNQKYVEILSKKGSSGVASEIKSEFFSNEVPSEQHGNYINLLKLLALLEEVERRYEEYYHHMEDLISTFELTAGHGAGKSYTALALQAMSKHFNSLRAAILCQIRVAKQKIEKEMPRIGSRLAQLSLLDEKGKHNRISLKRLGIMHNTRQAWRPIRGLPENSVTILRAWLFEHFLHPYPNDSEKLILSSQTGLSKNQVSNWFINARVRLWKPMIEEMYNEEFSDPLMEFEERGEE